MLENTMPFIAGTEYLTTCLDSYLNIGSNSPMISPKGDDFDDFIR